MSRKQALTLVAGAQDYFRELLVDALGHQRVQTKPETEFYLVNLLNRFMQTDHLYSLDGEGHRQEEPLALMMKQALEQSSSGEQQLLFRQIGDVSLYKAGFFQDSLSRKLVGVDYYIGMGGTAYLHAARRSDDVFRVLFQELAEKFARFVEVLAEISDKTGAKTEKDLLRIYDLWIKTKSERAAKTLRAAGIVPNETIKKKLQ